MTLRQFKPLPDRLILAVCKIQCVVHVSREKKLCVETLESLLMRPLKALNKHQGSLVKHYKMCHSAHQDNVALPPVQ